jgi:hypothetical protein
MYTKYQFRLNIGGSIINLYRLSTINPTENNWVLPIKVQAFRKRLTTDGGREFKYRSRKELKTKLSTNFNT